MLRITRAAVDELAQPRVETVRGSLQAALALEHATIPPYLAALYSIKPGYNMAAAAILRSVVRQEMLHMTIAANVLNAMGGTPELDTPGFIPSYPGPLPMGIHSGLNVGIRRLSRTLVAETFMAIEEPEYGTPTAPLVGSEWATIGQFYRALCDAIQRLGRPACTGDPSRQVVYPFFPPGQLFPVRTEADAVGALEVIIRQGEGNGSSPIDIDGEPAHYFRFGEIVSGRTYVSDPTASSGYSYSGDPVGIDPAGIWNVLDDARTADYPRGSRARLLSDDFNVAYTNLLRALQATFNGHPSNLGPALGLMYELKVVAAQLVATELTGSTYQGGPTFEYAPVSSGAP